MNIVIYNINSFGGNYLYSTYLLGAYSNHQEVENCIVLMPTNAEAEGPDFKKILVSDDAFSLSKWKKKLHFIYRSIINPLKLFAFLKKQPPSFVILNDFDQLTAFIWVPLFRRLKKEHRFAVVLHDPDRDNFFSRKWLSKITMKKIMSIMDIGFFHGYLPDKDYYRNSVLKVAVPLGLFAEDTTVDKSFLSHLQHIAHRHSLVGVLGNIRPEKNYELIIDALQKLPTVKLLVAGKAANSSVSLDYYKQYASDRNVADKIIWVENYLEQSSFNASIAGCEIILLCYKPSFTSQSAVLSSIAPFYKKLIITDVESSLKNSVKEYNIGEIIPQDNVEELVKSINKLLAVPASDYTQSWNNFMNYSSWNTYANIAVSSFKMIK